MSTFYDENGNEKETMQSEETENLRKRKRKKKAKLRKIKRKVKKLKNSVFGDLELLSKQDRRKMKKYKNQKKALKKQLNIIERQLADHERRLADHGTRHSRAEDGISRIIPVIARIQGYQKQEILQKITASNDIREIAKLLENAQGGVFNVKSL